MNSDGSVSLWLEQLREGDPEAAERLWEQYFPRLAGLARLKLAGVVQKAGGPVRHKSASEAMTAAWSESSRNTPCRSTSADSSGLPSLTKMI